MLAPVAEAHFGEGDLAVLNLAAAAAWPGFARDLEAATGPAGPLPRRRDPGGGRRSVGPGGHRPGARLPPGHGPAGRPTRGPGLPGGGAAAGPRRAAAGSTCPPTTRSTTARWPWPSRRPAGRPGSTSWPTGSSGWRWPTDRVLGVVLDDGGPRSADVVVVAAGSRSGAVAGLPEAWRPPVRPVRGVTLRLAAPDGVPRLRRTVRALVHGRSCYLVPRDDGGLVLGATVEERGFALDVPARRPGRPGRGRPTDRPRPRRVLGGRGHPGPPPGLARQRTHRRVDPGRRAGGGHRALPQRHPAGPGHGRRGGAAAGRRADGARTPDRARSTPSAPTGSPSRRAP